MINFQNGSDYAIDCQHCDFREGNTHYNYMPDGHNHPKLNM